MFQQVAGERVLRTMVLTGLTVLLLAAATAQATEPLQPADWSPIKDELQVVHAMVEDDESEEEEPSESTPQESSSESAPESEQEPEPTQDRTLKEAAAVIAWVEESAPTDLERALGDLERQADETVQESQAALSILTVTPDSSGDPAQTQDARAEEAPPIPKAVVVATVAAAATAGTAFVMFWTAGSTVGSAGTAAAGKGSAGLKRVAPAFSPLFTRFEGKEVLQHPNRRELYALVAANPGVRLQDLCEETTLSRTAVTHHLRLLEQQHLIISERMGRSRHYYENGGRYERQKKDAYAVLQNGRSKDIAQFIIANPGTIQKGLCEALDLRASIIHWHIKRLCEASLIESVREGRTVSYYPAGDLRQLAL